MRARLWVFLEVLLKYSNLLLCDPMSSGESLPTFRPIVWPSSWGSKQSKCLSLLYPQQKLTATYQNLRHHWPNNTAPLSTGHGHSYTQLLSPFQLKSVIFLPLQPGTVAVTALMCLGSYSAVCSSNLVYVHKLSCGYGVPVCSMHSSLSNLMHVFVSLVCRLKRFGMPKLYLKAEYTINAVPTVDPITRKIRVNPFIVQRILIHGLIDIGYRPWCNTHFWMPDRKCGTHSVGIWRKVSKLLYQTLQHFSNKNSIYFAKQIPVAREVQCV
jgi:hypothetical protein